jgi:hypothetical protein
LGSFTAAEREYDNKPLFDIVENRPTLRAVHVTANQAARDSGVMKVENLAMWEATGKHLLPLIVRITAQRTYDGVEALIEPLS